MLVKIKSIVIKNNEQDFKKSKLTRILATHHLSVGMDKLNNERKILNHIRNTHSQKIHYAQKLCCFHKAHNAHQLEVSTFYPKVHLLSKLGEMKKSPQKVTWLFGTVNAVKSH